MQQKVRKLVLVLMLVMAVASPVMQLDSWDMFPIATDDIELQIIMNLCVLGMFFVLAGILFKLFPILLRLPFLAQATSSPHYEGDAIVADSFHFGFFSPLRN